MSELRQRKPADGLEEKDEKSYPPMSEDEEGKRTEYLKQNIDQLPESVRPYLAKAAPFVAKGWILFEKSLPVIQDLYQKGQEGYAKLQKYDIDSLFPCVIGLAMAFFGGEFPLLIATVVAFRVTGSWGIVVKSSKSIIEQGKLAWAANAEDDKKDEDGDGVADVQQISKTDLLRRKATMVAKSVDPDKLADALQALMSGILAVVASLKLTFARTMTLGSAIGDLVSSPVRRYAGPTIKAAIKEKEFQQWVDPGIGYGCRAIAVGLAFLLSSFVASVHSAVQGGQLFTRSLFKYLTKHKIYEIDPEKTNLDEMAGYGVAVVGLFYQLFYKTPFLLTLILMPITMVEWLIRFAMSFA